MARIEPNREVLLSVLDRLLDDDPDVRHDPAYVSRNALRDLRASVSRDLETLLNTRRRALLFPDDLKETRSSILAFGVPDMTGANMASRTARTQFLRRIEEIVQRFEPRFKRVKVIHTDTQDPLDRTLRFKIEALLWAEPAPELVAYDSMLEPIRRTFLVRSGT